MTAKTDGDYEELEIMAREIWRECFHGLISDSQIEYMLDKFLTTEEMKRCAAEGYIYRTVLCGERKVGFVALHPEGKKMFLSKLYLYSRERGKGFGRMMLEDVLREAEKMGLESVYLTVNRGNARAIGVYERCGFSRVREQDADIGGGYVMDDYVMEKKTGTETSK